MKCYASSMNLNNECKLDVLQPFAAIGNQLCLLQVSVPTAMWISECFCGLFNFCCLVEVVQQFCYSSSHGAKKQHQILFRDQQDWCSAETYKLLYKTFDLPSTKANFIGTSIPEEEECSMMKVSAVDNCP